MILETYTLVHVVISLVGIFSGFVVLFGLLVAKRLDGWTKIFLTTTVATSVTGFFFPYHGFTPAYGVGIISLLVLAVAIFARYPRQLAGALDLRHHRCDCALSECVCRGRAGLPEGAGFTCDGTHADGAAI
jgi:hypothetical protein